MRLNNKKNLETTYEGALAYSISAEQELRRSVMSCMLWEPSFYEKGDETASRIVKLASAVKPNVLAAIAIEAREKSHLRHVPLVLLSILSRTGASLLAETIFRVVQRPDEMSELLAIHAKLNNVSPKQLKKTIPAQMKKGLAMAFGKFSEYQLAKYNRDAPVRLKDVLLLCHAKPKDDAQARLWKRLIEENLATPDTWEVELSKGSDKKETFERLIREGKLGYLALLRNLRNIERAGCDEGLIKAAILKRKGAERVLPFRYVAAARHAPMYEPVIDKALAQSIGELGSFDGKTVILVDVSGSMEDQLSSKSDLRRIDAAAALAAIWPSEARIFSFSEKVVEVPQRGGMAAIDAIVDSQRHGGTELGSAVEYVNDNVAYDRIVVITDEQSSSPVPSPKSKRAYMINVASYKHGIGYGPWVHIDGFSENVLSFIREAETAMLADV